MNQGNKELQALQQRLLELEGELAAAHSQREEEEEKNHFLTQRLREDMRAQAEKSRQEFVTLDTQHKVVCDSISVCFFVSRL